ncbi:hypothetical protein B0H16DRAFT_1882767 [Mycena metata]|uniref:Uncharacterized protein n=1 Tax=Mycena metata TaxID=1033252 RepID=A0AAD7NMS3_9AGAR|nr:hypothetical protein B0H16DRAFT_1882767 [Mycena metata]
MIVAQLEDILENILAQVYQSIVAEGERDGIAEAVRKNNFFKLALVSRNFVTPVRRNFYRNLRVEGTERFLLLTAQLRLSPHLAKLIKCATLVSNCGQHTHIDGGPSPRHRPGSKSMSVSATVLGLFLKACPQLRRLCIYGGDFLWALVNQIPTTIQLTSICTLGCPCQLTRESCMIHLQHGWLQNIVAFPHLEKLEITELDLDKDRNSTLGIPSSSSACTSLTVWNTSGLTSLDDLEPLIRSMPTLQELVLGLSLLPLPPGKLKRCLGLAASTLTRLKLSGSGRLDQRLQPWDNDAVAMLPQLKSLHLGGVALTSSFFDGLPARLEFLRLEQLAVQYVSTSALAGWLRREPFPHRGVLKKIELVGRLWVDVAKGIKASNAQVLELEELCRGLGIEWNYTPAENLYYQYQQLFF